MPRYIARFADFRAERPSPGVVTGTAETHKTQNTKHKVRFNQARPMAVYAMPS
jgi:hypothetical protein